MIELGFVYIMNHEWDDHAAKRLVIRRRNDVLRI